MVRVDVVLVVIGKEFWRLSILFVLVLFNVDFNVLGEGVLSVRVGVVLVFIFFKLEYGWL